MLEDIEEAFIYRYIEIKNLKRKIKVNSAPIIFATFTLGYSSDRTEFLKSGLVINNKKRHEGLHKSR